MRSLISASILVLGLSGCLPLSAATVDEVLTKLDQSAQAFTGISGDLSRVTYTKVIDEKETESGKILLRKQGRDFAVRIDIQKPDERMIGFRGRKAEIYYPKLKTVQEWDLGKHRDMVDQFLLVGFGSGKDLRAGYEVQLAGEEAVAGKKAWKLQLTPRAPQVKKDLQNVEIWIAQDGVYPIRQQFTRPSGDYYMFTYSGVTLNPALTEEALKLNLPKGVKREYPQK